MRVALKEYDFIDINVYLFLNVIVICDLYIAEVNGLFFTLLLRDIE